MATIIELRTLARARFKEAQILFTAQQYDTTTYLCSYAIELALKARLCKTIGWTQFPETNQEFLQLTCEIIEKSLKNKRFQKLYHLNPNDFCDWYEKYFQNPRFLQAHNLETLLIFSGVESKIRTQFAAQWSIIDKWDPKIRYKPIGSHTHQIAKNMLTSTQILLGALN